MRLGFIQTSLRILVKTATSLCILVVVIALHQYALRPMVAPVY